jgi:Sap-like sulfolipid-1-addressing protein
MLATAAGFAVLAAISPTAILACAVYLGSARPRQATLLYLAGAISMTLLMALVVLFALRAGGLSLSVNHDPRYGVRLALGVLALGGGLFMARRKPRPPDPEKPRKPGLIARTMARPGPLAAFVTGIFVFTPSASFVAAVQVIATARASVAYSAAALATVVIINVMLVWLPFLLYLARPEATTRRLKAFNGWLRAHGHALVAGALLLAGGVLTGNGIYGLA